MNKLCKNLMSLTLCLSVSGCNFLNKASVKQEEHRQTATQVAVKEKSSDDLYTTYEMHDQAVAEVDSTKANVSQVAGSPQARMLEKKVMGLRSASVAGEGYAGVLSDRAYFPQGYQQNTESYDAISDNGFHQCTTDPLSTFSIDVDTASYANVRRFINQGQTPPADAVRVEELINYFDYNYAQPERGPFAVNMELAPALWNKNHRLVRIGIKGREMQVDKRPASNLVFLIDVSGSMNDPQKLPLVKSALSMLVDKLNGNDKISMVVYAGAAGLVLPSTRGNDKFKILRALDQLSAGGSTNGGGGIELAYKIATEQFIKGGVNRVILATDGDFNVGVTDRDGLLGLVEKNAKKNIYLSALGFGMGNYKDGMMAHLSNKGNGNYAYIDSQQEARKVMVEQLSGTLVTIAKDVKLQVEFNPRFVQSYRLVGYEDRLLKNEEFNDDKKDAGDIGAGHSVTALYEIVPVGVAAPDVNNGGIDALKYQKVAPAAAADTSGGTAISKLIKTVSNDSNEWLTLKIRYKKPDGDVSAKDEFPLVPSEKSFASASESFRFASAVALYGQLLRSSPHVKEGDYQKVISIASAAKTSDKNGYRTEFIELVRKTPLSGVNQVALED